MEQEEVEQSWRDEGVEVPSPPRTPSPPPPSPEKEHPSPPLSQRKVVSVILYHAFLLSSALLALKHHTPQWAGICVLAHYFWNSVAVESDEDQLDWGQWRWDKVMRKKTKESELEFLRPTEILMSVILGFSRKSKKKKQPKPVLIIDCNNKIDLKEEGQHKLSIAGYKKLLHVLRNKKQQTNNISSETQCLFFLKSICPMVFLIQFWITILMIFDHLTFITMMALLFLIGMETLMFVMRVHDYYCFRYTCRFVPASRNTKIKHALEIFGTFLLCGWASAIIPMFVLWPAVYFAFKSLQETNQRIVVYIPIYSKSINFTHFKLIKEACRYGNYISVGLIHEHGSSYSKSHTDDLKKAIFESYYVSEVIVNAPPLLTPQFVNYHNISYVVVSVGEGSGLDIPDLFYYFSYPIQNP